MRYSVRLYHVPNTIVGILVLTVAICFYLACFHSEHIVRYRIPFISDLGTFPPESCIFAQGMNMYAALLGYAMYIKYKQVQSIFKKYAMGERFELNRLTFTCGMISVVGLSLVANFQETNLLRVHFCGALAGFGIGTLYMCLQTMLYLRISFVIGQKKLICARIFLCLLSVATFVGFIITGIMAYAEFQGKGITKWTMEAKDAEGLSSHAVNVVLEWIIAIIINVYIMMFHKEFKKTTVEIIVGYEENTTTSTPTND